MKLVLSFVFLLPLCFAKDTRKPKMAQMILKDLLSPKAKSQVSYGCFKASSQNDFFQEKKSIKITDYFDAKVNCEVKCMGSSSQSITITNEFNPAYLGLFEGDGSSDKKIMWRSLGHTIQVWSKDQCSQAAAAKCKEVESFKFKNVSSGTWKMDSIYNCKESKLISSPFAIEEKVSKKEKSRLVNEMILHTTNIQETVLSSYIKEKLTYQSGDKYFVDEKTNTQCKYKAKVKTCFGDCLFETDSDHWPETLSTDEPLGDYPIEICLDKFTDIIRKEKTASGKDLVCHKLIWEIFMKTDILGTSCAAFRYDYECPKDL